MSSKINIADKRIIILGIGGIGKCISHYLSKFFVYKPNNLYLIDKHQPESEFITIKELIKAGANFIHFEITNKNYKKFFSELILEKSIVIDCTTRTPCILWLKYLTKMDIFYINTSIECPPEQHTNVYLDSISYQHKQLNALKPNGKFLIEYGMNPGLITSFCYLALDDISKYIKKKIVNNSYAKFAEDLKIIDIHCSEIDTQTANIIDKKKFNNTWSAVALLDELKSGSELYCGCINENIDQNINKDNIIYGKYIDNNKILLTKSSALNNKGKSKCYTENINTKLLKIKNAKQLKTNPKFSEIVGYYIHHGEILDIGTMLKTKTYAPNVAYVYNINIEAEKKLKKSNLDDLIEKSYDPNSVNVMNNYNNKLSGTDNIGIYIKTNYLEWWCGTVLSNDYVKNELKDIYFGPTVIQVMSGVLGGLSWLLQPKQQKGLYYGRHVNHKYIFNKVRKYLNIKSELI